MFQGTNQTSSIWFLHPVRIVQTVVHTASIGNGWRQQRGNDKQEHTFPYILFVILFRFSQPSVCSVGANTLP